jgi:tetratricopeptide (TPR) repeat protein
MRIDMSRIKMGNVVTRILVLLLLMGIVMFMWWLTCPKPEYAWRVVCGTQVSGLGKTLYVYANDSNDGRLPPVDRWCDSLIIHDYTNSKKFICKVSDAVNGESSYAINKNLAGLKFDQIPDDVVLLFETEFGKDSNGRNEFLKNRKCYKRSMGDSERKVYRDRWNQSGGPEILTTEHHEGEGCNVVFGDMSVRFVKTKDLPKLKWKVAEIEASLIIDANGVIDNREPATMKMNLRCSGSEKEKPCYKGAPLTLSVSIKDECYFDKRNSVVDINEVDSKPFTMGTKDRPWFRCLNIKINRVETSAGDETKKVPVLEELDWFKYITWTTEASLRNQPVLDHLRCSLRIDPNISESLVSGQYVVTAVWDSKKESALDLKVWRGRLEADPVEITIKNAEGNKEQGMLAFARGAYHLRKKDYDSALRDALKVEKLYPSYGDFSCYTIAATAYDRKRDFKSAIEYYQKYLDAHKDSHPELMGPELAMIRGIIDGLQQLLDDANEVTK